MGRRELIALVVAAGCSSQGNYVWIHDYAGEVNGAHEPYLLGPGDLLDLRVFHEDGLSGKLRVRNDGMVSVPFLGDVRAAGLAPPQLAQKVEAGLKDFIRAPTVTVAVEEPRAAQVPVVGEVKTPGMYPLVDASLLQAIATAGGLTQYAARDRIYVLRPGPTEGGTLRVRFRFDELSRGEGRAAAFRLRPGDSVVIE